MSKRISDAQHIVGYFAIHAGEPEADTIYDSIRGIYRLRQTPVKRAPGRPRTKRVAFVQAAEPGEVG